MHIDHCLSTCPVMPQCQKTKTMFVTSSPVHFSAACAVVGLVSARACSSLTSRLFSRATPFSSAQFCAQHSATPAAQHLLNGLKNTGRGFGKMQSSSRWAVLSQATEAAGRVGFEIIVFRRRLDHRLRSANKTTGALRHGSMGNGHFRR